MKLELSIPSTGVQYCLVKFVELTEEVETKLNETILQILRDSNEPATLPSKCNAKWFYKDFILERNLTIILQEGDNKPTSPTTNHGHHNNHNGEDEKEEEENVKEDEEIVNSDYSTETDSDVANSDEEHEKTENIRTESSKPKRKKPIEPINESHERKTSTNERKRNPPIYIVDQEELISNSKKNKVEVIRRCFNCSQADHVYQDCPYDSNPDLFKANQEKYFSKHPKSYPSTPISSSSSSLLNSQTDVTPSRYE